MIDLNALKIAVRARLIGDATLMTLVGGVFSLDIPATVDWSKPVLEFGVQAEDRDEADGYGQDGSDVRLRLMAHARGEQPGVGSFDDLYTAMQRAALVLVATALTVSGQTVWQLRRMGSIPETSQPDTSGYPRMSAGLLFQVRAY